MLKELCEYFLSPELSDFQVEVQTKLLHSYIELRLSLIDEDETAKISPKHVFSLHYEEIIRTIGCLIHYHTNRWIHVKSSLLWWDYNMSFLNNSNHQIYQSTYWHFSLLKVYRYTPLENVWHGSKIVVTFGLIKILTHPC